MKIEGFDQRTSQAESYLAQQWTANHHALQDLERGLQQHAALLKKARDYANQ